MFCESYRQALSEAALSGDVASARVRLHLSQCASCRQAFAEEQALDRAIDSGISATVNTQAPASLVPLVRFALSEAPATHRRFRRTNKLIPVGISIAALLLLLPLPRWIGNHANPGMNAGAKPGTQAEISAVREPKPSTAAINGAATNVQLCHPARSNAAVRPSLVQAAGTQFALPTQQNRQEAAVAQVVHLAQDQPQLVSSLFNSDAAKPIDIRAIEVPELTWAPLAEETDAAHEREP